MEGWGSEQIHEGAQISKKPPIHDVERFLSMLRFDAIKKLDGQAEIFSFKIDLQQISL
jgi:hypothetical protein